MTRLAFVGLSAAATTGLAAAGEVTVPEDDPAIAHDRVELRRPDAVVPAYAAWPVRPAPNVPSVVVIMHIWGVDSSIRDVVRRLAKAGFAAIAP
ncbi:MAG: dienelactone hydrolase family protein, partial [Candidatus Eremiobacteraeota bacterium]|nr:dienelactone hydrolase family protein [Candidatus Eremiobacteraeota bacterium]